MADGTPPSTKVILADSIMHFFRIYLVEAGEPKSELRMTKFDLYQNYPNPFGTGGTTISFTANREPCEVSLNVCDLTGRLVQTLFEKSLTDHHLPLATAVSWNGRDSSGRDVASGVYFHRLQAEDFVSTRKMVLVR